MIDCHRCEHYYVTWDKRYPHGCNAMGFKSREFPSSVVRSNTPEKMECLLFHKKELGYGDREIENSPQQSCEECARCSVQFFF